MIRQIARRLEKIREAQKDLTTEQLCPRCGLRNISAGECVESIVAPGVFICTECEEDELDFKEKNVPLEANFVCWHTLRPNKCPGDFRDKTCEEAWELICEQQQEQIFKLYFNAKAAATPEEREEVEFEAEETLPGLESCWAEKFQLRYPTVGDSSLLVKVEQDENGRDVLTGHPCGYRRVRGRRNNRD